MVSLLQEHESIFIDRIEPFVRAKEEFERTTQRGEGLELLVTFKIELLNKALCHLLVFA